MDNVIITKNSTVEFFPLFINRENDQNGSVIVGREDTAKFVELPEIGLTVIQLLQKGITIKQCEQELIERYDTEVDVDEFVEDLLPLNFIRQIDHQTIESEPEIKENFSFIRSSNFKWLSSKWLTILALLIITLGWGKQFLIEGTIPSHQDFFWSEYLGINVILNLVIFWSILLLHEFAHLISARNLNIKANINISTRLYLLVLQTDVTGIWARKKKERVKVYLAGMKSDATIGGTASLLLLVVQNSFFHSLLEYVILTSFLLMISQLQVFLRTDLYFVTMEFTTKNLYERSIQWVTYVFARIFSKTQETFNEIRVVKYYSLFLVLGVSISLSIGIFYGLPIFLELIYSSVKEIETGFANSQFLQILSGSIIIGVEVSILVLFIKHAIPNMKWTWSKIRSAI
ncbi:hypothetical protein [Pontibacillus salipaludis]|uniref:Uncharacterized protein n=1 Tax=Pontibacillus salipaludis TaxID=1697394 RepID=A0ABQ1Q2K7_9BACI|nr:hypothetical protein [Pontibacillus salipaludis]GGD10276.1 hypothetical protein GCM10011389_17270 [Pontibacillus salipaludis]